MTDFVGHFIKHEPLFSVVIYIKELYVRTSSINLKEIFQQSRVLQVLQIMHFLVIAIYVTSWLAE